MTTAGRFNKILFLKFLGKRVTASEKHQLPNTNFRSFSVKISVKISESDLDEYYVQLVCAKGTTAPKSEASGYLILTRLLKVVINSMDVKPAEVTLTMDSQCTISAVEKSGGLLAPYFASRIAEASSNLSEVAEDTVVNPIMHVPGLLNPADIPTRPSTTPEEVLEGTVWQNGPSYLSLPKDQWPFSREFMDILPAEGDESTTGSIHVQCYRTLG